MIVSRVPKTFSDSESDPSYVKISVCYLRHRNKPKIGVWNKIPYCAIVAARVSNFCSQLAILNITESIWCIITVEENGLLGITQQLASAPLGCTTSPQKSTNPFGSIAFAHHQSQYEELPQIYDQRKTAELTRIGIISAAFVNGLFVYLFRFHVLI